jgi:hypothetical protein
MGRLTVGLVVGLALTTAVDGRADPTIEVTRPDDPSECPDVAELMRLTSQVQGSSASHSYRVSFERQGGTYRAEVVDLTAATRTRHIEDESTQCAPLGRAVALALVTMWDTEQEPLPAPPAPHERTPPPPSMPPRAPVRWLLSAGGGVTVGVVRPAAPALVVDSAFERRHLSWALGAVWIPLQSLELGPGSIEVQLLAGSARGCARVLEPTHLGICARAMAGALLARSHGYSLDGQQSRPWLALGLEAFVEGALVSHLRYRAAACALAPLYEQTFSIQNLGAAYTPSPVGGLFTLALEFVTP